MARKKLIEDETLLANLSEKSDEELREILDELYREEERISYERRILHGKIDILKAELTARLKKQRKKGESIITGKDIDRLAEILAKGSGRVKSP